MDEWGWRGGEKGLIGGEGVGRGDGERWREEGVFGAWPLAGRTSGVRAGAGAGAGAGTLIWVVRCLIRIRIPIPTEQYLEGLDSLLEWRYNIAL